MQLRETITVPGVPFTWSTNLSDDGIREFYEQHGSTAPWQESGIAVATVNIKLRTIMTMVPFRDGACQWRAVNDQHRVVFRTTYEWELWEARKREREELSEEQEHEQAAEYQLFCTEDNHLRHFARKAFERDDFVAAAGYYSARVELRRTFNQLPKFATDLYSVIKDSLMHFAGFPDATYGLSFLQEFSNNPGQYHTFVGIFWFWRRDLPLARRHIEEERIYDAAFARFPTDGQLYKIACLFWRREKRLDLAIKYCRTAIASGARDHTKSGFAGRLKRLISEHERR